jgi:hypothetical protein
MIGVHAEVRSDWIMRKLLSYFAFIFFNGHFAWLSGSFFSLGQHVTIKLIIMQNFAMST